MKLSQAIFAISIVTSQSAFAQIADCDRLASSPLDPQKQSTGVRFNKLDHIAAIPACKIAIAENKQAPRLWFQYGRALEKANKLPDAIIAYQEAVKLGSGAANNNMGELYRDGKGFEVNLKMAEDFFKKSSDLNSTEGKDNLLKLLGNNKLRSNQATQAPEEANNEKIKKEPIELQNNNKSA
jgi:TPR repeat protein